MDLMFYEPENVIESSAMTMPWMMQQL